MDDPTVPRPLPIDHDGSLPTGKNETLADFLKRRERELIQQTAALRGMLIPKEQELAAVHQAMQAVGVERSYADALRPFLDAPANPFLTAGSAPTNPFLAAGSAPTNPFLAAGFTAPPPPWVTDKAAELKALADGLTIKEMILRALNEHFHLGATPSELSDYMRTAYGREVDRNSISPQLARLREEGLVHNTNALNGKWEIVLRGNLEASAAEIERKNINALASAPRVSRLERIRALNPNKYK